MIRKVAIVVVAFIGCVAFLYGPEAFYIWWYNNGEAITIKMPRRPDFCSRLEEMGNVQIQYRNTTQLPTNCPNHRAKGGRRILINYAAGCCHKAAQKK